MLEPADLRSRFEQHLRRTIFQHSPDRLPGLVEMVRYHFGWDEEPPRTGKRLRPMILLLTCGAFGCDPNLALPAAASLEIFHNFTLLHDDIEDGGETRHGRPAFWKKYGIAQAINTGDLIASLANRRFMKLQHNFPEDVFDRAFKNYLSNIHQVFRGQYLDMHFEEANEISDTDYYQMIDLKTARLFSAAFVIGGILAQVPAETISKLDELGTTLGLGFQIRDDYLGIWGEEAQIGKSTASDLGSRKRTLPIIYALAYSPKFKKAWETRRTSVKELFALIDTSTVKNVTLAEMSRHREQTIKLIEAIFPQENLYSSELLLLINSMLGVG